LPVGVLGCRRGSIAGGNGTMSQDRLWLIVGLGNPGRRYQETRHNMGFFVIEGLAQDHGIDLGREKFQVQFGRGFIDGVESILGKPQAFMNRSGPPIRQLADYFRITKGNLLVIHDDIDLIFGKLKIKEKGGHGGHNGLKSLMESFGGGDFPRLRVGIGRSEQASVTDHVLGKYTSEEKRQLQPVVDMAKDAVVTIVTEGLTSGMNRFNGKRPVVSS
jgi:PTH1 family peptidyl-tRNA hydrolase